MSWSGLAVNFGNDLNGGQTIDMTQVNNDLTYLKNYTNTLRIAMSADQVASGIANSKQLGTASVNAGFYTLWGVDCGAGITNAQYTTWKSNVMGTYASWATANHMNELVIGNEIAHRALAGQIGSWTDTTIRADLRLLFGSVKTSFPTLKISHSDAEDERTSWISEGVGSVDTFGINLYDNIDNFITILPQTVAGIGTTKLYFSEWAAEHPLDQLTMTDYQYNQELVDRLTLIKRSTAGTATFFTWRMTGSDHWQIIGTDNRIRPAFSSVISNDRMLPYTTRTNPASRTTFARTAVTARANIPTVTPHSLIANGNTTSFRIRPYDPSVIKIGLSGSITLGASVYLGTKGTDNHTLAVSAFDFGGTKGYDLQIDPTTGAFHVFAGQTVYDSGTGKVPYNQWAHVVYRIASTKLDCFVNGTLAYGTTITRVASGTSLYSSDTTYFGEEGQSFRTLNGTMTNIFSVQGSLTNAQIGTIGSTPGTSTSYPTVDILWFLNEGTGALAVDSSGNSNYGAITNANWGTAHP